MELVQTPIPGLIVVQPKVFGDERGFFLEAYNSKRYEEAGIPGNFVQDNVSFSSRGILRGLHFQNPGAQGKLVTVLQGEVFDVAVDIRYGSPTFGKWYGLYLNGESKRQFWIPAGFAHGFVVTSESALFTYKCDDYYRPQSEFSLLWNDPDIGIQWPIEIPRLSAKDEQGKRLCEFDVADLPRFME